MVQPQPPSRRSAWWPPGPGALAVAAVVAVAYAVGAGCAFVLFNASDVAVFYPPAGVTLAALVVTSRRRWPAILLAVAAVELSVDVWQGQNPRYAWGFVLANVVEPLVGAGLLRRLRPGRLDLTRRSDAWAFLLCAVLAGPAVGAVIGSSTIAWGMGRTWWDNFAPYWAGDGLAVLTLGAAVVAAVSARRRGTVRQAVGEVLIVAAVAGVTVAGFWPTEVPLAYLPLPLLIAVGFRGRMATVGAAGFVMAFAANLVTATGRGPWAALATTPRLESATLQLYLALAVLAAWALASEVAERDLARRASRLEETARLRLQALQEVTAGLATAATSEQILDVLVRDGVALVADRGVVGLLDPERQHLVTRPTERIGESAAPFARIPRSAAEETALGQAAWSGRRVMASTSDEITARFPGAVPTHQRIGVRSVLAVPILLGEQSAGALSFGFDREGAIDAGVLSIADTLAGLAGQALDRARLYEAEHDAAHQLQRSLLPRIAADLPGVEVGVRYLPADGGHEVGGDWYDVFALPGNRVAVTVGDAVGHDLSAAIAMGSLQQVARAAALAGGTPADVLERLDDACRDIPGGEFATVGYAEYAPSDSTLTYACAGHPPPLLVAAGVPQYLDDGRSPPIGIAPRRRPQVTVAVPDGATLLWYSDGLVERRVESIDVGLQRLADAAAGLDTEGLDGAGLDGAGLDGAGLDGGGVQAACDLVLSRMIDGQTRSDDVVVVCLRLLGGAALSPGEDGQVLRRSLSRPNELAQTRRAIGAWAAAQQLAPDQAEALQFACNEALTNAIEHAHHASDPHPVELTVLRVDHLTVRVEVIDRGRWRPGSEHREHRGRGLMLMNQVAARTVLDLGEQGTRVTLTLRVP